GGGKGMRFEVATSEAHGLSTPRRFRLDGREVEVVEVLDQWFGADYRYSKVKGDDGALYILRLDENRSEWTSDDVRKPGSTGSRAQSGFNMHQNG
ncbi:MAG TPA: hypothetical protein VF014_11490, partial [Casimicrobiaceae bacterium]|nr:hypothetical protein [Casimicrobiaceae bacterium]